MTSDMPETKMVEFVTPSELIARRNQQEPAMLYKHEAEGAAAIGDKVHAELYNKLFVFMNPGSLSESTIDVQSRNAWSQRLKLFIEFAEKNIYSLGPIAIEDASNFLRALFFTGRNGIDSDEREIIRKATNKTLTLLKPATLFRTLCVYGLLDLFEKDTDIDAKLKEKFKSWKADNPVFVRECRDIYKVLPALCTLTYAAICSQDDPEEKRFYEKCRAFMSNGMPDSFPKNFDTRIVPIDEMNFFMTSRVERVKCLNKNWKYIDDSLAPQLDFISILTVGEPEALPDNVMNDPHPLYVLPAADVFNVVKNTKIENYFLGLLDKGTLPGFARADYDRWLANPEDFQMDIPPVPYVVPALVEAAPAIEQEESKQPETFESLRKRIIVMEDYDEKIFMEFVRVGKTDAPADVQRRLYSLLSDVWDELRDGETNSSYLRRIQAGHANFIEHIIKHRGEFESCDYMVIFNSLPIFYANTAGVDGAKRRKQLEICMGTLAPYSLFKAVHMYGASGDFKEGIDNKTVPQKFRAAYPDWVKKNGAFIEEQARINVAIYSMMYMERRINLTESIEEKKFFMLCHILLQHAATHDNTFIKADADILKGEEIKDFFNDGARVNVLRLLTKHWDLVEQSRERVEQFSLHILYPLLAENDDDIKRHPLNIIPVTEVFAFVHLTGQEEEFQQVLDTKAFPHVTFADYERWKENPDAFQMDIPPAAEAEPLTPPMLDAVVEYHNVHHPIVVRRHRDEGMGMRATDEDDQIDANEVDRGRNLNRTKILADALKIHAAGSIEKIDVYLNVNEEREKDGHPYNLISVMHKDGTHTNIAVCDYVGNMTLVERNATPYHDDQVLDREDMRKKATTWPVAHFNDKQWIDGVKEVLYTDLTDLNPALKNRSYWHPLGEFAVQTLTAKFMMAGRAPSTLDTKTLIDCGPLAGRSKFNLLYAAFNRGAVGGWEKGTTFSIVLDELMNGKVTNALRIERGKYVFADGETAHREEPLMPWLKKFENKPPISVGAILEARERFRRQWGFAVGEGFYDELLIDNGPNANSGRTGVEVDIAFQFKSVAIPPEMLENWGGRYPDNLDDFFKLSEAVQTFPEQKVA